MPFAVGNCLDQRMLVWYTKRGESLFAARLYYMEEASLARKGPKQNLLLLIGVLSDHDKRKK